MPIPNPLGPYRLERRLGGGGFADVYLAFDARRGHQVALKVLHPQHASGATLKRFQREGEQMLALRHQHVVGAYDVGEIEGYHTIAMPYMPAGSLTDLLRTRGRLDLPAATRIVEQVAAALDFVHPRIIHRDLKPSNILLDPQGHVCVADFGVAHVADESTLTPTDAQPGTPQYMAPEQARPRMAPVSPATDTWALGVILYEMLCGQPPFAGEDSTAVLYQVVHEAPPRPTSVVATLPPEVDAILARALAKDPRQRYQHAGDLARDLRRLVGPTSRPSMRVVQPPGAQRPQTSPRRKTPTPAGRKQDGRSKAPWIVLGSIAAAVVLIAAIIFAGALGRAKPTPAVHPTTTTTITPTAGTITSTVPLTGTATVELTATRRTSEGTRTPRPTATATRPTGKPAQTPTAPPSPILAAPVVVGPVDNWSASLEAVTFQWQSVPGAATYRVETHSDRQGQTAWQSWGPTTGTSLIIRYSDHGDYFSIPGTVYYWRVVALDTAGRPGNYSAERKFIFSRMEPTDTPAPEPTDTPKPPTSTRRPTTPAPTVPAVLAAPVVVGPEDGWSAPLEAVTFRWQSVPGAAGYRVETRSDRQGQTAWYSWGPTAGTSLVVRYSDHGDYFSIPGTVYYWRVVALNANGRPGNYSAERRFTFRRMEPTDTPAPEPAATYGGSVSISVEIRFVSVDPRRWLKPPGSGRWKPVTNRLTGPGDIPNRLAAGLHLPQPWVLTHGDPALRRPPVAKADRRALLAAQMPHMFSTESDTPPTYGG